MIDYSKYNLAEMQAIVTVLDDLTDEMSLVQGYEQDFQIALAEFMRASARAKALIDQQARDHAAAEAEKVDRIKQACIAGAPPAEEPDELRDLRALVDILSWCSDRLAALALAEDRHFAECSRTDVFNKMITLRNANRSIIDLLADIRDHYDGLH